jgi:transposase
MANQIKMATRDSIYALYERGWSQRRIARELGLDRETVGRHLRLRVAGAEPAITPAGSAGAKPAITPLGWLGRPSACRGHHAAILEGIDAGLTAQRIFQDLRTDHGFDGSYDSVKRYVRRLTAGGGPRITRMECDPGEEAQVDFGLGAPILRDGRKRRTWVFRIVLSHSRKAYSEAVLRQDTESFIRALENAFRAFGGVPKTLVIDNLRAAVARADWYEPELTPKVAEFCRHYGTVILPTRPRTPEHKGKVERGVGYVKSNALKGRVFDSLAEENRYLVWWESHVADQRLHGTTRQHVGRCFVERERPALQALPPMPFPCFTEGLRTVHRDGHIEVAKAYYDVPEEYIGRTVWVRYDSRLIRVFNHRMEPLKVHARLEPGQFSSIMTDERGRRHQVMRSADYWCERAQQLGGFCGEWAHRVRLERGPAAIRALVGLYHLGRRVGYRRLDTACAIALDRGTWRLRDLRRLLEQPAGSQQLTFLDKHPLIRDLAEYGRLVQANPAPAGLEGPSGAATAIPIAMYPPTHKETP